MSRIPAVVGAAALSVVLVACGGSSGGSSGSSGSSSVSSGNAVKVVRTSLGDVLVDSRGRTVYELSADSAGHATCTGDCNMVWPAVKVSSGTTPTAGTGVTAVLSVVTGGTQVTAAGRPLYTYSGDSKAGEVNGQGIKSFGGTWSALTGAGTPVASGSAAVPTTSPSSGGTGGYNY